MGPIGYSATTAVREYVGSHLEPGESLRHWTYSSRTKLAPDKVRDLTFAVVTKFIGELIVGILQVWVGGSRGSTQDPDRRMELALIVLTDRRFLYANVAMREFGRNNILDIASDKAGDRTEILPLADTDEFQSLSISDIRSAEYRSGAVRGTLDVRLKDMSELAFYFLYSLSGQMAKEIAERINVDKKRP